MDGLIVRLFDDGTGSPGRWFWEVFGSIRPDLDRMFWCFSNQPWMGFPTNLDRLDQFEFDHLELFEKEGATSVQLWRPATLGLTPTSSPRSGSSCGPSSQPATTQPG